MNKPALIIILVLAVGSVILARFPNWSGQRPLPYEARSDARITEIQAGRSSDCLTARMRKQFADRDGRLCPLQAHRYLTPFLLRYVPGGTWRLKWAVLAVWSLSVMVVAAWYIGVGIGKDWRYGALCAALALGTVGWMIGRIPWHKDTVVTALEFVVIALLVHRRWFWLGLALVVGVLCKESFVFLAVAIGAGLISDRRFRLALLATLPALLVAVIAHTGPSGSDWLSYYTAYVPLVGIPRHAWDYRITEMAGNVAMRYYGIADWTGWMMFGREMWAAFGVFWIFAILAWRRCSWMWRVMFIVVWLGCFAACMVSHDKMRLWYRMAPVMIPMVVIWLKSKEAV